MAEKLHKNLSLLDVYCISSGAMISSGIFILPGLAFSNAGPLVFISYFLAGVLAVVGALSVIELATAMPKAGGDYYFVNRSLGALPGTVSGLFSWAAISLKSAFAIFGMAEIIYIISGIPLVYNALILTVIFVGINLYGVKEAAKLEVILVTGLIFLLIIYVVLGFFYVRTGNFSPLLPKGLNSIIITSGFVFVSFGGLISVTSISEEVINPKRNIPLGMLLSVISVTVLYSFVIFVTVGVLPEKSLSGSITPIADTAKILAGMPGYIVITAAAVFAFVTTAIAGVMSASRYPFALSQDSLLPPFFKKISKKGNVPYTSLLLTGIFIILSLTLDLETLVKAASTVILSANVFANISVIILRESRLQNYKPSFKVPFYPWVQIISILLFCFFIVDMGIATIEISSGFLIFALSVYFLYGKTRANTESALVHLIARVTNKEMKTNKLEEEFKEILVTRDNIIFDEFDKKIEKAIFLDINRKLTKDECFSIISKKFSDELKLLPEIILSRLNEREDESSTVIADHIAIPHIILDGEQIFNIMLVRAAEGINYSEKHPDIKAIFVIAGSRDKRKLHLRSLAAIAQIIDKRNFINNWLNAKNINQIKDMILLSGRKRIKNY